MKYTLYSKPYQSPSELITKLKNQNLVIEDEIKALKILKKVNYFRFKIYLRPLLNTNTKQYIQNSSFENAYDAYAFVNDLLKSAKSEVVLIDKSEICHLGASLKDLGNKVFAFSKMDIEVLNILGKLDD